VTGGACIAGIGETRYAKWGGITDATEHELALDAILAAVEDSGLTVDDVDGFSSFADDRNGAIFLAAELGLPELKVALMSWLPGGGGACASVGNAVMAVESGQADVVVAYRSLCQGQFHRFGQGPGGRQGRSGERPPSAPRNAQSLLEEQVAFTMPFGMLNPPIAYAMVLQRHMHLFGTTSEQLGAVAVRTRAYAQHNPRAVMHGLPMTLEDHQASRVVAEPFHLFDCCLETDGACAVVVTSAARARDLAARPVRVLAHAQGSPHRYGHGQYVNVNLPDDLYASGGSAAMATRLWRRAGITANDVDAAMLYDHFSGLVLLHAEDFGFCARGEGGPWFADTALPINTHGGSLSEAYIHGLNHVIEGVRQLRGTSTSQVDGCETVLVTSAAGVPASALVLAA
jgi:acetyl-CoA acetyltransferase